MKTALVLEGGAMRGIYTAGILDAFMEKEVKFDAIIGVSAGALFGVNYLSEQKGRAIRYNKKYNSDPNYMGIKPLIKTGNFFDTEYAYEKVPRELDPFDDETFKKNAEKIPFFAVLTNMETGKPAYNRIRCVFNQMDELRASGSMPFVSKPVELFGKLYLDGGIADSIPFEYMLKKGYDRVVVVMTKSREFVRKPMNKVMVDLVFKEKYPKFARALRNRHIMYNRQVEKLAELEKEGKAIVIRPSMELNVGRSEKNPEKLQSLYDLGISDAAAFIDKI
jgi:predicted patatin/cPLA2 family phospholipase